MNNTQKTFCFLINQSSSEKPPKSTWQLFACCPRIYIKLWKPSGIAPSKSYRQGRLCCVAFVPHWKMCRLAFIFDRSVLYRFTRILCIYAHKQSASHLWLLDETMPLLSTNSKVALYKILLLFWWEIRAKSVDEWRRRSCVEIFAIIHMHTNSRELNVLFNIKLIINLMCEGGRSLKSLILKTFHKYRLLFPPLFYVKSQFV